MGCKDCFHRYTVFSMYARVPGHVAEAWTRLYSLLSPLPKQCESNLQSPSSVSNHPCTQNESWPHTVGLEEVAKAARCSTEDCVSPAALCLVGVSHPISYAPEGGLYVASTNSITNKAEWQAQLSTAQPAQHRKARRSTGAYCSCSCLTVALESLLRWLLRMVSPTSSNGPA